MINDIISDITTDRIKLSQALNRLKVIENKINNERLNSWLRNEIEGYEFNDSHFPEYRKIRSNLILKVQLPSGSKYQFIATIEGNNNSQLLDLFQYYRVTQPVVWLENTLEDISTSLLYVKLFSEDLDVYGSPFIDTVKKTRGVIYDGHWEISRSQIRGILEFTKQAFIDLLIEIREGKQEFIQITQVQPLLGNNPTVQNIINNHVYGNNSPVTVAAGMNVEQAGVTTDITENDYSKLEQLGVSDDQIEELKQLIRSNNNDTPSLTKNILGWLSKTTGSIITKGLVDNLPALHEQVHNLIQHI